MSKFKYLDRVVLLPHPYRGQQATVIKERSEAERKSWRHEDNYWILLDHNISESVFSEKHFKKIGEITQAEFDKKEKLRKGDVKKLLKLFGRK